MQESIDSILCQSFSDFEFLIVDDGSSDRSLSILENYKDKRLRIIRNGSNKGLAYSLNVAVRQAKGDLLARMDADDISMPDRFARQSSYLSEHPDVGVLGSRMEIIDATGKLTGHYDVPLTHNAIAWRLLLGNPMAHPSVMIRRNLLESFGGYNEQVPMSQDKELWARLINLTRFANLPDRLVRYRRHQGAVWVRRPNKGQNISSGIGYQQACRFDGVGVSQSEWDLLYKSLTEEAILSDSEIKLSTELLLQLYSVFIASKNPDKEELKEIRTDFLSKMITIARRNGAINPAELTRTYWRTVIPKRLWKIGRKVVHYTTNHQ